MLLISGPHNIEGGSVNQVKHLLIVLAVTTSLFLIFSQALYASNDVGPFGQVARAYYLDPGTGSIIIQFVIGTFVAGLVMIGVYRGRVKTFLSNLFTRRGHEKKSEESD